jgi:hypothetical protein
MELCPHGSLDGILKDRISKNAYFTEEVIFIYLFINFVGSIGNFISDS